MRLRGTFRQVCGQCSGPVGPLGPPLPGAHHTCPLQLGFQYMFANETGNSSSPPTPASRRPTRTSRSSFVRPKESTLAPLSASVGIEMCEIDKLLTRSPPRFFTSTRLPHICVPSPSYHSSALTRWLLFINPTFGRPQHQSAALSTRRPLTVSARRTSPRPSPSLLASEHH